MPNRINGLASHFFVCVVIALAGMTPDQFPTLDKLLRAAKNVPMITTDTTTLMDGSRPPKVLVPKDPQALGANTPHYSCHRCGTTSYRPLLARSADGAMRVSGRYACTGCRLEFDQLSDWTEGPADSDAGIVIA